MDSSALINPIPGHYDVDHYDIAQALGKLLEGYRYGFIMYDLYSYPWSYTSMQTYELTVFVEAHNELNSGYLRIERYLVINPLINDQVYP